jgi:hypothetical protein
MLLGWPRCKCHLVKNKRVIGQWKREICLIWACKNDHQGYRGVSGRSWKRRWSLSPSHLQRLLSSGLSIAHSAGMDTSLRVNRFLNLFGQIVKAFDSALFAPLPSLVKQKQSVRSSVSLCKLARRFACMLFVIDQHRFVTSHCL